MLVLRKEIKIGIAVGLAILGIAGVYGLMASLSGGSKTQTAQVSNETPVGEDGLNGAVGGLPPKENEDTSSKLPVVIKPPIDTPKGDPFSESARTDGMPNTKAADIWSSALSSGHIDGGVNAAPKANDAVATYRAPTTPKRTDTKADSKLVSPESPLVDAKSPSRTNSLSSNASPAVAGGSKYKIQAGDSFSTISAKFYGSKKYYSVLSKANPDVNPSRMKIGQEITVPPKEAVASVGGAIEPDAAKLSAPIDATRQYRVAPGDTLSHIASKLYHKSTMWQAIYEANKSAIGTDEAKLKVGMLLELPEKPVR